MCAVRRMEQVEGDRKGSKYANDAQMQMYSPVRRHTHESTGTVYANSAKVQLYSPVRHTRRYRASGECDGGDEDVNDDDDEGARAAAATPIYGNGGFMDTSKESPIYANDENRHNTSGNSNTVANSINQTRVSGVHIYANHAQDSSKQRQHDDSTNLSAVSLAPTLYANGARKSPHLPPSNATPSPAVPVYSEQLLEDGVTF